MGSTRQCLTLGTLKYLVVYYSMAVFRLEEHDMETKMSEHEGANRSLSSLIKPLESTTSTNEFRDAIAATQRLRDDGSAYFRGVPNAHDRWVRGCNELIELIYSFSHQIQSDRSNTLCVLGKFTSEFDHTKRRFLQMSLAQDMLGDTRFQTTAHTIGWLNLVYEFSARGTLLEFRGKRLDPIIIREYVKLLPTT